MNTANYRFLETVEGATRFAKVTLQSEASPQWKVTLTGLPHTMQELYGDAIRQGLNTAMAEQDRHQGPRYHVTVTELVETTVDTTVDAVECAATIAAWKSFDGKEDAISLLFVDGHWVTQFDR
jgi:hypothetical protein